MKKYDVAQHNNRHHCKYLGFYVWSRSSCFHYRARGRLGKGKEKKKAKRSKKDEEKQTLPHFSPPLHSPLTLLLYSFSRPCFPRFIDWLHELKIKCKLSEYSFFFNLRRRNFSCVFKSAFLWSLTHFPPCCSRYCARTSDGTKIERKKKGRGARKKEKKKTIATHTLNKIFTTAQSKSSSW